MPKILPIIAAVTLAAAGGCSNLQFPGVYKLTINQGNIITQDIVDQLKPGMSRAQVEYVMGNPLVKDTFNQERWDYVFSVKPGDEPAEIYHLSVFFEADRLTHFTGDFRPTSAKQGSATGETAGSAAGTE